MDLEDIDRIEISSTSNNSELMKLSAFKGVESHNIILHFKSPQTISKVFGIQKEYSSLGVFVDESSRFVKTIEARMSTKVDGQTT